MKKIALFLMGLAGCASAALAQSNNVSSVVINAETNEPVSGASVVVTGTSIATTTDINGKFSIDAPAEYQTLTVSYNNMQPTIVNILPKPIVMTKAKNPITGWGIEVGLSSAKISVKDESDDNKAKSLAGFTAGITYDFPITSVPNLSIMPGLFYAPKGATYGEGDYKLKQRTHYLELQVAAKYAYPLPVLNNDLKVFALAGPYFAYGIADGVSVPGDEEDYEVKSLFNFCKRFDAGLVLGLGVEYKQYSLTFRYGLGLMNINDAKKQSKNAMEAAYKYYEKDYSWEKFVERYGDRYDAKNYERTVKNRSFMITLGYRF